MICVRNGKVTVRGDEKERLRDSDTLARFVLTSKIGQYTMINMDTYRRISVEEYLGKWEDDAESGQD